MSGLRKSLVGWRTRLADIASVSFIVGLVIITLVLLGGPSHPPLENTYWQLEAVAGQPVAHSTAHRDYLLLAPAHDQMHAAIDGQPITGRFRQLGVPRQLHLEPHGLAAWQPQSNTNDRHRRYLDALKRTRGETIEGRQLVLRDGNGRALAHLRAVQRG